MKTTILILAILASLIPTHTEAFYAPSRIAMCERTHYQGSTPNRFITARCDMIWRHLTWQHVQSLGGYPE